MSASFADAVRGGGQSLAGKPPEEDDAWSGKVNPLEAVLRCPKTIAPAPVLQALLSRCGPTAISCVRSISATNYVVTCSSETHLQLLINEPVMDIDLARCTVSRAGEPLRSVTLRNVPFDATDDDLRTLLQPYASLLEWSHEVYKDFPGIANGNRRLHIKMPSPLPNFLTFRKKRVVVSYNGVQLLCFKCGSPDHSKRDCPKVATTKVAEPVDPVEPVKPVESEKTAAEIMPPPETPTRTNKRKKANASPALTPSPSPRSRKRYPPPSPASSDGTPSPSTRLHRSSSNNSLTRPGPLACRSPLQHPVPATDETMTMPQFHELLFKEFIIADDDGMHFRPGVSVYWIKHWCKLCGLSGDTFLEENCSNTPRCEGYDVAEFGLPTGNGRHLLHFEIGENAVFCFIEIGPKKWNALPFDAKTFTQHLGPLVPEYASVFN